MVLRITVSLALVCGLAGAEEGPWSRYFNHPAVTAKQGEELAMSKAMASLFNPLKLKDKDANAPVFPQLAESQLPVLIMGGQPPMVFVPCSVPLMKSRAEGQFFMKSLPGSMETDRGMARVVPVAPCK